MRKILGVFGGYQFSVNVVVQLLRKVNVYLGCINRSIEYMWWEVIVLYIFVSQMLVKFLSFVVVIWQQLGIGQLYNVFGGDNVGRYEIGVRWVVVRVNENVEFGERMFCGGGVIIGFRMILVQSQI